jgi:hypothetical protein
LPRRREGLNRSSSATPQDARDGATGSTFISSSVNRSRN